MIPSAPRPERPGHDALVLGLVALAVVIPFWCASWLPLMDAPQHFAVLAGLARYDQDPALQAELQRVLAPQTNVLFHLLALPLVPALGVETAARVVLSLGAVAWVGSLAALARSLGRRPLAAALALPLILNGQLQSGYLNFWLSWPLIFSAWALVLGGASAVSLAGVAVLAFGAFVAHAESWFFLMLFAPLLAAASGSRRRIAVLGTVGALTPSLLYAAAWLVPALASTGRGDWRVRGLADLHWNGPFDWLGPFWVRLFFITRAEPLEWAATVLWVLGIGLATRSAWAARRTSPLFFVGAALFLATIVLPEATENQYFIATRLMAPAFVCLLVGLGAFVDRWPLRLGLSAFSLHLLAMLHAWRATEPEIAGLRQVLTQARPGSRMLSLVSNLESEHVMHQVFLHIAALHTVQNGGQTAFSFQIFESSPLRFRDRDAPWHLTVGQEHSPWCQLLTGKLPAFDYYLWRAGPDRCQTQAQLERQTVRRAHSGDWTLYEGEAPITPWSPPSGCRCRAD